MITKIQTILLTIVLSFIAASIVFAEAPSWVQKPVQCASPESVFDRIESDGLLPLFSSTGNARVENEMYALPYGFFYNPDTGYWLFVEFFSPTSACVIGVGEGVDFDVEGTETKSSY